MRCDTRIIQGDCTEALRTLPDGVAQTCVTSPPYYGLRSYLPAGHPDKAREIGTEKTPQEYIAKLVAVFREVWRVLRDDGTLWLNLGDSYAANRPQQVPSTKGGKKHGPGQSAGGRRSVVPEGLKPKDLLLIPHRVAMALQADGWWLRSAIVWNKPNPMPESVTDRPSSAYEMVFLLAKAPSYFYDADAIREEQSALTVAMYGHREGGRQAKDLGKHSAGAGRRDSETLARNVTADGKRNARNVWTITPKPFRGAHFAVMPPEIAERCIMAGSRPGDVVLDPFGGAGTTGLAAKRLGRHAILCDLDGKSVEMARERIEADVTKPEPKRAAIRFAAPQVVRQAPLDIGLFSFGRTPRDAP